MTSSFEVSYSSLEGAGESLKKAGLEVEATPTVGADVSEPPQTAAALRSFGRAWDQGIDRLGEDIQILGGLAQIAANGYLETDRGNARGFGSGSSGGP